jgi:transposase
MRSICYRQVFASKHREATMIHQWKKALLEGAAGIFERGGKAAATAEIAEGTVRDLHAKIGELAVANDFLARKLKPWTGK